MKLLNFPNSSCLLSVHDKGKANFSPLFRRMVVAVVSLSFVGCVSVKIRPVDKTVIAPNVQSEKLEELLKTMSFQYGSVATLNLTVNITATEGGAHQGQVKELPSFAGYILLRKPADLHVLMLVPFVRSRALDMVSDGKNFKMLIPSKNRAVVGPEEVTTPSKNGLENLRPNIVRDALQIAPVGQNEYVTLTQHSRILPPLRGKKESVEEPDYDLAIQRATHDPDGPINGHTLELTRILHISRVTLLPFEQDLYDSSGRVVTTIYYDKFQKFNGVDYPMSILIKRPLDEYTLRIDITKLLLNQKLDDEEFLLKIPEGVSVQQM